MILKVILTITANNIWAVIVLVCMVLFCGTFVESVCRAWRVGVRRVWGPPSNADSVLLPLLCCRLPLYDELMKRLLTFTHKCFTCDNQLVNFMVRYAVWHGRMKSPLGCSIFQCCSRYDLSMRGLCY